MNKYRKVVSLLVVLVMVFVAFSGCNSVQPSSEQSVSESQQAEVSQSETASEASVSAVDETSLEYFTSKIEPLSETVHLNVGACAGILHDLPAYIAYSSGLLEKMGIECEMVYFNNGPMMAEAMKAGSVDCGGYGLGGLLYGSVQDIASIIHIRANEAIVQKYFAKNDSDLAQSGLNAATGFYGTAEDWAGKQVYCPPGTTLQYLLGKMMGKLDMTFEDIDPVYMDAPNVNTALYAGQGEVWGLWNLYGYATEVQENYTELANGETMGLKFYCGSVASNLALEDPVKKEAISKWLECELAIIEWMNASPDNKKAAADSYYQWCEEQGIAAEPDVIANYVNEFNFFSLEDNYTLLSDKTADGNLLAEDGVLSAMEFFIEQGNYTEEDKAKITDGNFTNEFIVEIMDRWGVSH